MQLRVFRPPPAGKPLNRFPQGRAPHEVDLDARKFLFGYDDALPLDIAQNRVEPLASGQVRHISYLSSGPVRVPALLSLPASQPRAAILLQHGGGESKEDPLIRLLMRNWTRAGYACLAVDAPGHGERAVSESPPGEAGGRRGSGARGGFFEYLRSRVQNVIDLRRALDLLRELDVGAGRTGYWGVSMGGSVGVILLATDLRIDAACLCLTGARSRRTWPDVDQGAAKFAAIHLDPLALATEIEKPPVLMLNGLDDQTIWREDAERLFHALRGPREQRWFKTGHKVTPAMLRASGEFFDETLSR